MPTRNVVLTDHQSALIDRLVAEGRYQNASEAIRAGLRSLERQEQELAFLIARGDAALALLDDPAARFTPMDEALDAAFSQADAPGE